MVLKQCRAGGVRMREVRRLAKQFGDVVDPTSTSVPSDRPVRRWLMLAAANFRLHLWPLRVSSPSCRHMR